MAGKKILKKGIIGGLVIALTSLVFMAGRLSSNKQSPYKIWSKQTKEEPSYCLSISSDERTSLTAKIFCSEGLKSINVQTEDNENKVAYTLDELRKATGAACSAEGTDTNGNYLDSNHYPNNQEFRGNYTFNLRIQGARNIAELSYTNLEGKTTAIPIYNIEENFCK